MSETDLKQYMVYHEGEHPQSALRAPAESPERAAILAVDAREWRMSEYPVAMGEKTAIVHVSEVGSDMKLRFLVRMGGLSRYEAVLIDPLSCIIPFEERFFKVDIGTRSFRCRVAHDCWLVEDECGGTWQPNSKALYEITQSAHPERTAAEFSLLSVKDHSYGVWRL